MDMLEAWLHFLVDPESEVVKELEEKHEEIKGAKELLRELSEDPEVVKIYNERIKVLNKEDMIK